MATYVHEGNSIDHTPSSAVAQGEIVVQGKLVGVAQRAIPANTLGALALVGVYDMPKATGAGTDIAVGAKCYYKPAAGENPAVITDDADDGGSPATPYVYVGKAVAAATTAATTVRVRLEQ